MQMYAGVHSHTLFKGHDTEAKVLIETKVSNGKTIFLSALFVAPSALFAQ